MLSSEGAGSGSGGGSGSGNVGGSVGGNVGGNVGGGSSQSLLSAGGEQARAHARPFVVRSGRTFLADGALPYPLPVDLAELHRQSLRTLLLFQLFGGPVCAPALAAQPPTRVLEVACGAGFWSAMCHEYYARRGHRGRIAFTGFDIAPIGGGGPWGSRAPSGGSGGGSTTGSSSTTTTTGMNWRFVQHDLRRLPWPFASAEFDLVMVKDVSLAARSDAYAGVLEECIRVLQPGGTLEVWDSDHAIRLLRPHVPAAAAGAGAAADEGPAAATTAAADGDAAVRAGAYVLTPHTPLSAPLNTYIVEYNAWLIKALEARSLPFAPCALTGALFVQEAEALTGAGSRRLAVPLSEMRWEREGVGGVVTKDGKAYIDSNKGKRARGSGGSGSGSGSVSGSHAEPQPGKKTLTPAQAALRRTALLTVVQMIQGLEPVLREVSGKSQDEWDGWAGKMMNDLMREDGTFWGESLEVGAWWAQKR